MGRLGGILGRLEAVLERLEAILGRLGGILAILAWWPSWTILDVQKASCVRFAALVWGPVGGFWGSLGALLGSFWLSLAILGQS